MKLTSIVLLQPPFELVQVAAGGDFYYIPGAALVRERVKPRAEKPERKPAPKALPRSYSHDAVAELPGLEVSAVTSASVSRSFDAVVLMGALRVECKVSKGRAVSAVVDVPGISVVAQGKLFVDAAAQRRHLEEELELLGMV